jgi:hypothetical protein
MLEVWELIPVVHNHLPREVGLLQDHRETTICLKDYPVCHCKLYFLDENAKERSVSGRLDK